LNTPLWTTPVSFKLGGRTWKVEYVDRRGQWLGKCSASRCRIRLNRRRIKSNEELRHTFIHELMHAIAATMGWGKLDENEYKIDAISNLLTQFESTAQWGE
jgi:predicted SprT family Zn-dependent metalloprotease